MKEDVLPYSPSSALENLPGSFPVCSFETPTNYEGIATPLTRALENLNASHLIDDSLWRDVFALTGTMRTFYSADSILKAWFETHTVHHPQNFKFIPGTGNTQRLDEKTAWINISFTFETMGVPATQSIAIVSLIPGKDGQWKIWLLRTVLEQLKGCEDVDKLAPVLNELGEHNDSRDLPNGVNGVASNSLPRAKHFDCVVVGAGQSGLGSAGRLQALGVSYLAIDKNEQVGDNWLNRYDSARLHTIREYSHLPFDRTFSDSFQQYLTKYDLAKGYKQWVRKFDIGKSVWFSTTLESGSWDENNKLWTLNIRRHGTPVTLTARHVILAIGPGGQIPITPELPGRGQYKGTVLHSSEYTSSAAWTGKSGIVVGTANTAHDVAEDMVEAGLASTVMVQRRRTYVLPCEYLNNVASKSFNVDIPTADADRDQQSMPNVLGRLLFQKVLNSQAVNEAERFDALERVGFKVERYGDLMWHIAERLGGHYMDVGCSEKISKGEVRIVLCAVILTLFLIPESKQYC